MSAAALGCRVTRGGELETCPDGLHRAAWQPAAGSGSGPLPCPSRALWNVTGTVPRQGREQPGDYTHRDSALASTVDGRDTE